MTMFKQHGLRRFVADFGPLPPAGESPTREFVQTRIAQSLMEDNIMKDLLDFANERPVAIGNVRMTVAAMCQIQDNWPPSRGQTADERTARFPLKYFTCGFRQKDGVETIDVEIYPGVDDWTVDTAA